MSAARILLQTRYRARADESIDSRHTEFVANMSRIGPPLGFSGVAPPATPQMRDGDLSALEWFRYLTPGVKLQMHYKFRSGRYLNRDESHFDDSISIEFKTSNKALNYCELLHEHFPRVIEAYCGYRARALYSSQYDIDYTDCFWDEWSGKEPTNPTYWKLRNDKSIDVDGRNNIYTLEPAMYWDAELCQRALGFGRDEVIQRLNGKVPRVEPLMDGVYVVFNDDPALSYEAFVQMNQNCKALLGLI